MEEEELQWHRQEDGGGGKPIYFTNHQDMGLKEGEEGLGEGGMGEGGMVGGGGEEVVASVGLDLTNDVEAHSRQRPVTPRIAGPASQHHHIH